MSTLVNECFLAKIGFDTAESGPSIVRGTSGKVHVFIFPPTFFGPTKVNIRTMASSRSRSPISLVSKCSCTVSGTCFHQARTSMEVRTAALLFANTLQIRSWDIVF